MILTSLLFAFLVFSSTMTPPFTGINGWVIQASANFVKSLCGFVFHLLSVSHYFEKHLCFPYPKLDSIPSKNKPFHLLHCDMWGLSLVSSILGFCHYTISKDDFSCAL